MNSNGITKRKDKCLSIKDAVKYIKNGDRIAFGGFAVYQRPMAFVHEIIRAEIKDLRVVGVVNANEVDLLAGAGCISEIETSYVGLEKFGLARNFRRKVEDNSVKVFEYSELMSWDRFRASQEGLPYWPSYYVGGSDLLKYNKDIKQFTCPITGKKSWAIPAADPDVVVIHAAVGDKYGNIQIPLRHMLPQSLNITLSRSCSKVIVTLERIVDTDVVKSNPHLTLIPAFKPLCVVEIPWGAHPTGVLGEYNVDENHLTEYVESSKTESGFKKYLDKYIYGCEDFDGYLKKIGKENLNKIIDSGDVC